ncbi:hypothetical protein DVH24_005931 [Malus domestica]|uniref:Uncharacterized protein n=1 Tax=Malus domestica TaxID=3750 RepID=A0A498IJE5_MALDO|nr:hypothetical protein DVH24_005931 [Malus domestica]
MRPRRNGGLSNGGEDEEDGDKEDEGNEREEWDFPHLVLLLRMLLSGGHTFTFIDDLWMPCFHSHPSSPGYQHHWHRD